MALPPSTPSEGRRVDLTISPPPIARSPSNSSPATPRGHHSQLAQVGVFAIGSADLHDFIYNHNGGSPG